MKRMISLFLCLAILLCAGLVTVSAADAPSTTAPADATETNTGSAAGNAFFIFALILLALGSIYLFFRMKK